MWGEQEGFGTAQEVFDSLIEIPEDDFLWEMAIGDPGPIQLFDFPVYARGAMTLQALRMQVGDAAFFKILKEWTKRYAGGTVTTAQFIALSEEISHQDLGELFDAWLSAGKPAGYAAAASAATRKSLTARQPAAARHATRSLESMPAGSFRSLAQRLADRPGNPFKAALKKTN